MTLILGGHFRLISSFAKVNNAVADIFVLKSRSCFALFPETGFLEMGLPSGEYDHF